MLDGKQARKPAGKGQHGHKWQKGKSGNPRGRPKTDFTLQALAQQYSMEGLHRLVAIMRDEKTKPETVVTVVGMFWDRGFGKAPSSLDVTHKLTVAEEFEAFIRQLNARKPKPVTDVLEIEAGLVRLDRQGAEDGEQA